MNKVLIVSGGSLDDVFARKYLSEGQFSYVIAADAGMGFFYRSAKQGIDKTPDLIVGDFDSTDEEMLEYFKTKKEIEWRTFSSHKDNTDTEIAVLAALEKGAEEVHILGGLGSRMDHSIANIYLLSVLEEQGVCAYLVDEKNRIRIIDKPTVLQKQTQYGKYVSLIPFMGNVTGVTLEGFCYPLKDYNFDHCHSIGISNEIEMSSAKIWLRSGRLLLIESRD